MKLAKKKAPYIPYSRQSIDQADIGAVRRVLESDLITQGPLVEAFESKLAEYCGARFGVAAASGTAALHLAAIALDLEPGDEVITSPLTFLASANCALYCGARVRFADIDPETWNLSPSKVRELITPRTKAFIAVHFAGLPAPLKELHSLAQEKGISLIEDAAHALGARYGGERIGNARYSRAVTFSFHPVKQITTGEGGMVLTNEERFATRIRRLRSHGMIREPEEQISPEGPWYYEIHELGFNYRITDFQCALGLSQLDKLESFLARRTAIARRYCEAFQELKEFLTLPVVPSGEGERHAWHLFIILLRLENLESDRKTIFLELRDQGIGVNVHYIPIHLQPFYQKRFGTKQGDCPVAENFYRRALSLPIHPEMSSEDVDRVIQTVRDSMERHAR